MGIPLLHERGGLSALDAPVQSRSTAVPDAPARTTMQGATMLIGRALAATGMWLAAAVAPLAPAGAQATDVRFVLDFLLQGQQSAFVLGRERGYYAAQKVNLTAFDPGRGGADSITKVASGTHDIGFGDLSALIEFNARNPGRELIAVLLVYDQAPLSLISLKKAGIEQPADLMGRKGGAPTVDATYRLFNVFARINGVDPARVQWSNVQPQVREPMLVRGEIDFAAAWVMTAVPGLLGLGVKRDDINVMMLRDYGVDLYANVVFTTPAFARQNPDAVRGFVKATIQSWQNAANDPDAAVAALKRAEPLSEPAVELGRLKWALEFVVTPGVRQAGMGQVAPARLDKHIDTVTDGFQLPRRLPPAMVFDGSFLPPAAERQIARQ
jgi:NitT/TauT family transport system substrate-binding protein